jgi:ABC-2 type transport system ATP-binding protein
LYSSFYRSPVDWRELIDTLRLADKVDTQFQRLSGGQKQRLSIALALLGNPRVAVLDELTTGLDPQARRDAWDLIEGVRDRGVTVLLVTHFMEEAERLCDRLAVIDSGRVVALDSPAGLIARVDDEQRIRFRPSAPLNHALLADLPEVKSVERAGRQLVVTGTGNLLLAVASVLARNQIIAADLRIEQTSLEDAFVALTGRHIDD